MTPHRGLGGAPDPGVAHADAVLEGLRVVSRRLEALAASIANERAVVAAETTRAEERRVRLERRRWRAMEWTGRAAVVVALVLVAFSLTRPDTDAWQAQRQATLRNQFSKLLDRNQALPVASPATAVAPEPVPTDAVARIEIPAIDVNQIVVDSVARDDLRHGPGHYPRTALPGQSGNFAVAGHRTTYGAPFAHIDGLKDGNEIIVTTVDGEFVYRVTEVKVVQPTAVGVLADAGDDRITLTTCHPADSDRQRLVVVGVRAAPDVH